MPASRNIKLVFILALVSGLGPITIHVILPVLPEIQRVFAASSAVTQLTLTLGVVAMAISTIGYGPAADTFGRKPVLVFGLVLFIIGSAICIWSPSIEVLILGRIVQAIGGAAGMVVARATIRDMFSREDSARMIGQVMSVVVISPILSPVIGGFIVQFAGWQYVFILTTVMGAITLIFALPNIRETRVANAQTSSLAQTFRAFPALLRTPSFIGYAGYAGCGMGMFMVVAGGVPFLMADLFGRSPSAFGLFFMFMSASFLVGTLISSRVTVRIGLDRMVRIGSTGAMVFSLFIPALFLAGLESPWAIFVPAFFVGLFHGLAMPNAQAGAVSVNPQVAGSASGLTMFLQMSIGAAFGQAAGMLPHDSALPIAILIGIAGVGGFLAYNGTMFLSRTSQST
ncbi:MAG: multidrug effflux MFS transporter [Rhodospirillaceae bacterium]|jgi:DHA1 family bicyclomycin/chloramphenicol resistance-like MFS transporter|nr:multidrug effflux MFS transporter [Rhodospirillaceae bacterium]MBT3932053.1 multidrug effflux MFS transporter [Rhodospirillaceae bacterium]MBT4771029.1 multidrug effflux MFS transporter [Rhodospirillaceae bacterium]MBT5357654.1 multidrug effflux MFS transporter [Rhodospirillaceae bacterium]MBT5768914.1 multidrug effflux MFS transporter [Rhodospirillaceae bacterium]